MSDIDFEAFDEFLKDEDTPQNNDVCQHEKKIIGPKSIICQDCGIELREHSQSQDWQNFGYNTSKNSTDHNRCNQRNTEKEKSIYKDIENMGINPEVSDVANEIYLRFIEKDNQINRGDTRKGIIFACVFEALKKLGQTQPAESLASIFKISNKIAMQGIKKLKTNLEKSQFSNVNVTPEHIITNTLNQFDATKEQIAEATVIYHTIKESKMPIANSKPQTIACGIIFYWLTKSGSSVTIKQFAEKVGLRDITIEKVAKDIDGYLETHLFKK